MAQALLWEDTARGSSDRYPWSWHSVASARSGSPQTEAENLELTLMRLGRDYGWQEVARAAGLKAIEGDSSLDNQVEELERLTFGNALMIGRGFLDRAQAGLGNARLARNEMPRLRTGKKRAAKSSTTSRGSSSK